MYRLTDFRFPEREPNLVPKMGFLQFLLIFGNLDGYPPNLRVLNSLATPVFDDETLGQHKLAFLCPEINWASN